jgi:hypothetical protein
MSATGMMMPGDGSNPPENDNLGTDQQADQASTATEQSAYVAPTDGQPTVCANCVHFDGQGMCDHPEVVADPQVQGKVDLNGHSKFYSPKSAETAEGGLGTTQRKPKPPANVAGLGAGARFPKIASNTPNFQGD